MTFKPVFRIKVLIPNGKRILWDVILTLALTPSSDLKTRTKMPRSSTRGALTLMIGTLASRVTGLLRSSLLNQLFTPTVTDAFNVALRLPNLFRELLAEGALTNAFVPIYKRLPPNEGKRLSGALLSLLVVVNAFLLLLAVWAAPAVVALLLARDSSVDLTLTVTLTRAVFPVLGALSFSALAMGILNAEERFFAPAWAPVILNVITAALMLAYPQQALMLAIAFVVGGVAQLVFQLPFLWRAGLMPPLGVWRHPQLRQVLLLLAPFTFTTGVRQFLNVVATNLLSRLPAGSVTAFSNADLFIGLALGLFSVSPSLAFYSRLAAQVTDAEAFRETLGRGLRLITFLTVPAGLLLSLYAGPAILAVFDWLELFGRSGIDQTTLELSVAALRPLGLTVFPVGLIAFLLRTFYVRQSVRLPVALSAFFALLTALLYKQLSGIYGIAGFSWASVIVNWLELAVVVVLIGWRERFGFWTFLGHALRVWVATLLAVGLAWVLAGAVALPNDWWGAVLELLLGGGLSVALYLAFCARFRVPEVARLTSR